VDIEAVHSTNPGAAASAMMVYPIARTSSSREREREDNRVRDMSRRVLNVLVATVLLLLSLPVMVVVAVAVRVSSSGPIIFRQERVGIDRRRRSTRPPPSVPEGERRKQDHGGKLFQIYKFRTMYVNDSDRRQRWASKDDPRITPVGRFLRAYRLDELPQLFNVLKGDMNIVGPRPEQPAIFKELQNNIGRYRYRQSVLPGITGWAQVNHRYDQSLEDVQRKLHYDLEYLKRRSPMEDLAIMARTPTVMLFKQGSQ
jgi:lipopolysaccharide/colanic/teichoic acid biosynthesis glycosyltransferase